MKKILLLTPVISILIGGTVYACCPKYVKDLCPNIDGKQSVVPQGQVQDDKGNCVTDECPNIDGLQLVRPDNTVLQDGDCVDTPPPVEQPVVTPVAPVAPTPVVAPPVFVGK